MIITFLALGANAVPALAQSGIVPVPPYYAMTPSMPLTPYASSPLQQQILQNYRSQLQATQRDMLQQNPSGLGRAQIAIGHQLNALDLPANPPAALGSGGSTPGVGAFNPAPFTANGPAAAPPGAGGAAR